MTRIKYLAGADSNRVALNKMTIMPVCHWHKGSHFEPRRASPTFSREEEISKQKCNQRSTCTIICRIIHKNITVVTNSESTIHTTRLPRSTQPSTLRGMEKLVSVFGLSNNNKWRWWVWFLAAYRRTHSPGRLAWSEGRRPLGAVPYSSHEPGELSQWLWATMTAP